MNQIKDDEIDLLDLLQTLWNGKMIISAFVAIAALLAGGLLSLKDTQYESRLIYSVESTPPFYGPAKILADFQNKFYSVSVFEEWKQNNSNTPLVFKDFNRTEVVDGFVFSKDKGKSLVTINSANNGEVAILVRSNQHTILDDFFRYAKYINELMKVEYVSRAKVELNIIETRFKDFAPANDQIISQILQIDRYIVSAERGANVITIQHPTKPRKVSPKSSFILLMSLVIGGMVGVFFILVRNVIAKRKDQLAKAK